MAGYLCLLEYDDIEKLKMGKPVVVDIEHVPDDLKYIQIQPPMLDEHENDFWIHANSANAIRSTMFKAIEKHSRNSYQNNMNLFTIQWLSHLNDMILLMKKETENEITDKSI